MDPDTAVREGELSLAQQTQSYFGRFDSTLQRITEGRLITPQAAKELAEATKSLVSLWQDAAKRRTKQYDSQATVGGVGDAWSEYKSGFEEDFKLETSSTGASGDGLSDEEAYQEYLNILGRR